MEENIIYVSYKDFSLYSDAIKKKLAHNKEVLVKTRGKYVLNAVKIVTEMEVNKIISIRKTRVFGSRFEVDGKNMIVPEIEITLVRC